jgi:hypothetical protein
MKCSYNKKIYEVLEQRGDFVRISLGWFPKSEVVMPTLEQLIKDKYGDFVFLGLGVSQGHFPFMIIYGNGNILWHSTFGYQYDYSDPSHKPFSQFQELIDLLGEPSDL